MNKHEIQVLLNQILIGQDQYQNPLERVVFLHCNIAKIQPFIDGNKRTSRLVECLVLMNNNTILVYSTQDKDILDYRKALIHFYETGDYNLYSDYFLDRQIERINQLSLKTDIIFDLQDPNKKTTHTIANKKTNPQKVSNPMALKKIYSLS